MIEIKRVQYWTQHGPPLNVCVLSYLTPVAAIQNNKWHWHTRNGHVLSLMIPDQWNATKWGWDRKEGGVREKSRSVRQASLGVRICAFVYGSGNTNSSSVHELQDAMKTACLQSHTLNIFPGYHDQTPLPSVCGSLNRNFHSLLVTAPKNMHDSKSFCRHAQVSPQTLNCGSAYWWKRGNQGKHGVGEGWK